MATLITMCLCVVAMLYLIQLKLNVSSSARHLQSDILLSL